MCFSLEVSLLTGIFCWAVGFYLLQKPLSSSQRHDIIFLLIFSSVQFADAILWSTQSQKTPVNFWVTSYLIPGILSLMLLYNIFIINPHPPPWIQMMVVVGILYMFLRFRGYSTSLCEKKSLSSPIWGSNELKLWEVLLFAYMSTYPTITWKWICIPIAYMITQTGYGSMWCAIACVLSVYYLKVYP